jgi:SAM-dependent methyltransferase
LTIQFFFDVTPLTSERTPSISAESVTTPNSAAESSSQGGYDPAFFDQLARVEDEHFWFRARNRLVLELARRISSQFDRSNLVVEVGCGTGNVLRVLEKASPNCMVVGMELWLDGLRHARNRSRAALVQADVRNWTFDRKVDLLGMFDVLEHIPEDRETLASLWNCLAPGGRLLLTVPAHQFLWSYFDEAARHCRRYSPDAIRAKLTDAGFEVEFLSQFMASIFPLVWMVRKMRGLKRNQRLAQELKNRELTNRELTNDEFRIVPVVNQILAGMLNLEARWLSRGHRLPIGTSLVVVARKPV